MEILEDIIKKSLKIRVKNRVDLALVKRRLAKKYKAPCPSNVDLLKVYHELLENKKINPSKNLEKSLKTRPIRSLSGIVNVSVLTKPFPCPGSCIFCPAEKNLPKSYVSGEPAVERAKGLKFDPYLQVKKRIEMLERQGHLVDKIELRIIGGSFTYYPEKYKKWFLKRCFDGANLKVGKNLMAAQETNEKSKHRIVGISVETRPDLINEKEIRKLRELGVTMVEIGVQTVFNDILKHSQSRQTVSDTIKATELLKDAGFKVMYQMMPNLPKSTASRDKKSFEDIFKNQSFKPDWLKIYPCVVLKETKLYDLWKNGKYKSYSDKELISLIKYIKTICPYWVRIARVYRDITKEKIISGCKISNLREVVKKEMEKPTFAKATAGKEKLICHCIRCREIKEKYNPQEKVRLFREDYGASDGKEIFLSFEDKKRINLYSFLRLRVPSKKSFISVLRDAAIIRELHTYGAAAPLGKKIFSPQHRGLGKKLIKEAEKIAKKEYNLNKIAVISGVGVRNYYRKLGYNLEDTYMVKRL